MSERRGQWGLVLALLSACAATPLPDALVKIEGVRSSASSTEAAALVPAAYARAERFRQAAGRAFDEGDIAGAQIDGERALLAYQQAVVLARLARANKAQLEAGAELASVERTLATLNAERQRGRADVRALEQRLAAIQNRSAVDLAGSEGSQLSVIDGLRVQARLLCAAAQLLLPRGDGSPAILPKGLEQAQQALQQVDSKSGEAARKRAAEVRDACSRELTNIRRNRAAAAPSGAGADALLHELSQAGLGAPKTDDRGVVLTLRGLGADGGLSQDGRRVIGNLAMVAKRFPVYPVQVVVHQPHASDEGARVRSATLGTDIVEELRRIANTSNIAAPIAVGTALPLVDPSSKYRERNERVEVIFVSPRPL